MNATQKLRYGVSGYAVIMVGLFYAGMEPAATILSATFTALYALVLIGMFTTDTKKAEKDLSFWVYMCTITPLFVDEDLETIRARQEA